jgi:CubicO group peptidase (beta-lactamase class C family)
VLVCSTRCSLQLKLRLGVVGTLMLMNACTLTACADDAARRELFHIAGDTFTIATLRPRMAQPLTLPDQSSSAREEFDALITEWRNELESAHIPGGALAIVLDGDYAFGAGIGTAQAGESTPVSSRTLFEIASISKPILAAATLRAVEEGLIDTTRPVSSYLPYLENTEIGGVTLEQALSHTAGVADDWQPTCQLASAGDLQHYLTDDTRARLLSPAGRLFNYSNANYALVAAVLAGAAQQPFEDAVAERVFAPAGMRTATYDANSALHMEHATGQGAASGPVDRDCPPARAAGGVWASVDDLTAFARALLDREHRMLSASSTQTMFAVHARVVRDSMSYGLGVFRRRYRGLDVISHGGGLPGARGLIALVPERRFAAVALINAYGDATSIVFRAMNRFLDSAGLADEPVPAPRPLRDYVGTYADERGRLGDVRVETTDGRLWLSPLGRQKGPLDGALEANLEFDANDRVEFFVTRYGVARITDR